MNESDFLLRYIDKRCTSKQLFAKFALKQLNAAIDRMLELRLKPSDEKVLLFIAGAGILYAGSGKHS